MADTTYIDDVSLLTADTMNDLNRLHYTILSDPASATAVLNALPSPTQTDVTASRLLDTTYTNSSVRSIQVAATVRCAITLGAGNAYVQGKSDTATPPTTVASGIVGIQSGLVNEDNTFQVVFTVAAGKTYILSSSATNGTVTLGKWFETAF